MAIERVAVIGSGVMGSGIAAQIANAGLPVLLLDIVPPPKDGEPEGDRSRLAKGAIERMLKTEPAPFMHPRNAKLITPGNIDDDLGKLAEVDWIVEVVLEKLEVKHALYRRIEQVRRPGTILTSNTSTIPLKMLVDGMPEEARQHFAITHFFNPPRYMRLLELVTGPDTKPEVTATLADICDRRLGKGVVLCHDTPGFIANRIGTLWMQAAMLGAVEHGLTVEEADAVGGKPMGVPKTGVFGLMDLVGLDLAPQVAASLMSTLPDNDWIHRVVKPFPLFDKLIAQGLTGRKGKGGFYRLTKGADGSRTKEVVDLALGEYRSEQPSTLESPSVVRKGGLKALVAHPDKGGQYAKHVLVLTLGYTAGLVPEIADEIAAVDEAMRLGYAWEKGPFEMIDALGADWLAAELTAQGFEVPKLLELAKGRTFYRFEDGQRQQLNPSGDYVPVKRAEGVLILADIKRTAKSVLKNASASVWDVGDGVLCLEFTSKGNSLDPDIMGMIHKVIGLIGDGSGAHKALVIYNEGANFSYGANLGLMSFAVNVAIWAQVDSQIELGQQAYKALKYAPFPSVAAPAGMALGGGCEITLHASAIQAHAELYMGLVEVGVGLLPGWGGCKEMVLRNQANPKRMKGPMPPLAAAFEAISTAKVSRSAADAQGMQMLRPQDGITMNRDRLLADAKAKVLELLAAGYKPPTPPEIRLPGPAARAAMKLAVDGFVAQGKASQYDAVVSNAVATVLSGGDTDITQTLTEDDMLELERGEFRKLLRNDKTLARIEYTLENGKPLRN